MTFVLKRSKAIPQLNITLHHLIHDRTGTEYLHIHSPTDSNNVFSIAFPTPVSNSKGTPHILEHTTLCGSETFPVRDPFFKMLTRSLSTYMNAWTGSDFTMYPFSTQNAKDFANLRAVYLDAVFKPNLSKWDFLQEGWRIEPVEGENKFAFKGIVFNEMKGVFSSREALYSRCISRFLMQNSTYEWESGGLPLEIVNLSHEELLAFHRANYTLGKCKILTFGSIPLEEHVAFLEKYISEMKESEGASQMQPSLIPSFKGPIHKEMHCQLDSMLPEDKQAIFSISFLANSTKNVQETFNLEIICHLLFDGPSSPFHKALIDANIGTDYSPGTGYDSSTAIASISIGLEGIAAKDSKKVEQIIFETFEHVKRESFPKQQIDAVLHQLDIGQKYRSSKFGLSLASSLLPAWTVGEKAVDPFENVDLEHKKKAFIQVLSEEPNFTANLIDKYFLKNESRLHLLMKPSPTFNKQQAELEAKKLKQLLSKVSKEELAQQKEELARRQNQRQPTELLPCLQIKEIDPIHHPIVWTENQFIRYRTDADANELSFFKSFCPIQASVQDVMRFPLLANFKNNLGIRSLSMDEWTERVKTTVGSLDFGTSLFPQAKDSFRLYSSLSSYCLDGKMENMYKLMHQMLHDTNFSDHSRMETILNGQFSSFQNSIAQSGHSFAISHAASSLCKHSLLSDSLSGMRQLFWLKETLHQLRQGTKTYKQLAQEFESLWKRIFTPEKGTRSFLVSNEEKLNEKLLYSNEFLHTLNSAGKEQIQVGSTKEHSKLARFDSESPSSSDSTIILNDSTLNDSLILASSASQSPNSLFDFPFSTHYLGAAIKTVTFEHSDAFPLLILSKLLRSLYLHGEIREKGGAYGAGCSYSMQSGVFSFYSYRDPSPLSSVKVISACANWLSSAEITQQNLLEAKLAVFSEWDSPKSIDLKGIGQELQEISSEQRQKMRDGVLAVSLGQLKDCLKYFAMPMQFTVIGPVGAAESMMQQAFSEATQSQWQQPSEQIA
jgi:Zn-dependent M16 (insulinase) family peptidase